MNTYQWYTKNDQELTPDALHQILSFGSLDELRNLVDKYGEERLKTLFINQPKKIYHPAGLNFIKKFILHIDKKIDDAQYLKTTLRYTR